MELFALGLLIIVPSPDVLKISAIIISQSFTFFKYNMKIQEIKVIIRINVARSVWQ